MKSLFPCIFSTEFALCIPTVCIAGAITVARRGLKCSSPGENKHVLSTLPWANLWGEGPSRYCSQSVPKLSRSFRRFSVATWKSLKICFRSLQIAVWFPWRVERRNVANAMGNVRYNSCLLKISGTRANSRKQIFAKAWGGIFRDGDLAESYHLKNSFQQVDDHSWQRHVKPHQTNSWRCVVYIYIEAITIGWKP